MREKWENLPESERCEYEKQALSEKLLYDLEIKRIKEIAKEKIKKKKQYSYHLLRVMFLVLV